MNRLKKSLCVVMLLVLSATALVGCKALNLENIYKEENKIKIVCTTFAQYDWTREIIRGEEGRFQLVYLFRNGADLHSFQPTADDIISVSNADLLIYVGGENDHWLEDAMKESVNPNLHAISMMDTLKDCLVEEEVVEGMQGEAEEDPEEIEYDEHVWLSLENAKLISNKITQTLCEMDSEYGDVYSANLNRYTTELLALKEEYQNMVKEAKIDTIVVGDRYPFRYLTDECGLNYYAAFVGCSAESEASFETVTFLSEKVDELALDNVIIIENSEQKIADAIIRNTENQNQEICVLNSIQSVKSSDIENGFTYLGAMRENYAVLHNVLKSTYFAE